MPQADAASMYEAMRRRAQQTAEGVRKTEDEALQRRFNAGGRANAGAYQRMAAKQTDLQAQRENAAVNDINTQEQAYQLSMDQQKGQQAFQTSERLGQEKFAGDLANKELEFKKDVFGKEFDQSKFANLINAMTALKNSSINAGITKDWFGFLQPFADTGGKFPLGGISHQAGIWK